MVYSSKEQSIYRPFGQQQSKNKNRFVSNEDVVPVTTVISIDETYFHEVELL